MQLKIELVSGFHYSAGSHEFPVDIEISTETPAEVYSRVNVSAALLTRTDDSEVTFGFVRRVTPARRQLIALLPQEPLRMRIDVLEHDQDFEDYRAGTYRCDVKVEIGEKVGEDVRTVELQKSIEVALT
jgi:hypothetical protein